MWTLFAATLSVTSLSFMLTTIHRYVTIVRNNNNQHQSPVFSARWLPALMGTLWFIALFGGLTLTVIGPKRALFWSDLCYVDNSELYWVGMAFLGIFVTVPFLSVPFLYIRILKFIYRVSRQVGPERSTNRGHRTAVVLFILFGTFSLAFVPYFIRGFLVGVLSFPVLKQSFLVTWLLLATVSTINPVLFMTLFKPIRNGFVTTLCTRWLPERKVHVFVTTTVRHQ